MDRASLIAQLSRRAGITTDEARTIVDALFDPARGLLARRPAEGPVRLSGFERHDLARGQVGPGVEYQIQMWEQALVEYEAADVAPAPGEAAIAIDVDVPPSPDAWPVSSVDPDLVERGPADDVSRGFGAATERPAGDIGGAAMDVHGSGSGGRD